VSHFEAWTDKEIAKYHNRVRVLKQHNMETIESEELATRLLNRDRDDSDDRKVCLECAKWDKRCTVPRMMSIPTVLQRCDRFQTRG
jgi:hypothetical protein